MTEEEEHHILTLFDELQFSQKQKQEIPDFHTVVKAAILRDILNGITPQRVKNMDIPLNLQKNEQVIRIFNNVKYYEIKNKTRWE